MNLYETFFLFFSFLGTLLGIFFVLKKGGDRIANGILAAFLFFFSYSIFFNVLFWSVFDRNLLILLYCTDDIPIAFYGALFYLYIRRVTTRQKIGAKDLVHLLPLVLVLYVSGEFIVLPFEAKAKSIGTSTVAEHINVVSGYIFMLLGVMLGYSAMAYYKYIRPYKEDMGLKRWLVSISFFFGIFVFSWITFYVLYEFFAVPQQLDYVITFSMVLMVGLIAYYGFMYNEVFDGAQPKTIFPFVKYQRTGLSDEYAKELKNRLLSVMEAEKPYLDSDLRLDDIAEMLDVPRHHASQVINEHFELSFFDFINRYRIKEAELALKEKDSGLTIQKIAYQSGFNNRASFYKAFKKVNGVTPKEYKSLNLAS